MNASGKAIARSPNACLVAFTVVLWLCAAPARSQITAPVVRSLGCGEGLVVRADRVPLSRLLAQMAVTLDFQLHYWSDDDPLVSLDGRNDPAEWMAALSRDSNMMVRYGRDRACRSAWRIIAVWVLPPGGQKPPGAPVALGAAKQPLAPASAASTPRWADQGADDYLRAHGLPTGSAPAR